MIASVSTIIGKVSICFTFALIISSCHSQKIAIAQEQFNSTGVGMLTAEPSTLIALGFDLPIEGDSNRNAVALVEYRQQGDTGWQEGLPMFRLQAETVLFSSYSFQRENGFSGSIFDLKPNTSYEVRVTIDDPDGVSGQVQQTLSMRTRAISKPSADGRVFHVYPYAHEGEKQEPSFTGLLEAYYEGASHSDHTNTNEARVRPGDTILLHAGLYKDNRDIYGISVTGVDAAGYGTVVDGTYYLTADGTEERPIVIRAAGDGEVVFDGDNNAVLFNLMGADYNYFEGITVRNTELAFLTGRKNIAGSSGFTLMNSRVENVVRGVHGDWGESKNVTIMDNVFVGRHEPNKMLGWLPPWQQFEGFPNRVSGPDGSEVAVKVYGQGHVMAYNYVANFHDGIDHATYGLPDSNPENWPQSVDIYNNDLHNIDDNCIEADGAVRNIRVLRNRCFNSGQPGLSMQPMYGGPAYFIRNVFYNQLAGALKFTGAGSGAFLAHNTFISEAGRDWGTFGNSHFLNNLFVAQGASGWGPDSPGVFEISTFTPYSSSNYNGFAPMASTEINFRRTLHSASPTVGTPTAGEGYATLEQYRSATGQDQNSIIISVNDFRDLTLPDMNDMQALYNPEDFDLRLRPDSSAIDAGMVLPNVNNNFDGVGPDLGAYEGDQDIPQYGPREKYN